MGFRAGVKRAMGVGFRVLAGLFMLMIVIGVAYWGWESWQSRKLEAKVSVTKVWEVAPLPMMKPVAVTLKTRCAGGLLLYQLTLSLAEVLPPAPDEEGFVPDKPPKGFVPDKPPKQPVKPKASSGAGRTTDLSKLLDEDNKKLEAGYQPKLRADFIEQLRKTVAKYEVSLLDSEGFKMLTFTVSTSSFSRIVDNEGRPFALTADSSGEYCNREAYLRATMAQVGWHEQ